MLSCFTSINVFFDQYNVGKKLKKTLIEVKQNKIWLRLILISTFLCTVKVPKNDLSLHCRRKTKQLSRKELLNVTPASIKLSSSFFLFGSALFVLKRPLANFFLQCNILSIVHGTKLVGDCLPWVPAME